MTESIALCTSALRCLFEFQTLISAILAILAAVVTATVIWYAARFPVDAQRKRDQDMKTRKYRHGCAVMTSELQELRKRAGSTAATIRTVAAANKDITDHTRERAYLKIPRVFEDWEVMSILPKDMMDRCLELARKVNAHNLDVAGTGGAFGSDNFKASLQKRLDEIMTDSINLSNDITKAVE